MSKLAPRRLRPSLAAVVVAGVLGLGACARAPETIAPVAVSPLKYQGNNCRTLAAQVASLDQQLADLYARQRSNQLNDTVSTILWLHPRATVVGPDIAPTIALMKGEREAAGAVMQARC